MKSYLHVLVVLAITAKIANANFDYTECVNPISVGNFAFLFNCTPVGRTSDSMMVPT